jgi:hypothetical protein
MTVRRLLNNSRSILTDRKHLILFDLLESEQNVRNYTSYNIQNIELGEKTNEDFTVLLTLESVSLK